MGKMIAVYPNQKIVEVHKAPMDKENIYFRLNKEATFEAMKVLTQNEIKTYMYLSSNQDGYTMALSTELIAKSVGSTVQGIQKAVNGLIAKKYLIKRKNQEYDFFEIPQLDNKSEETMGTNENDTKPDEKDCCVPISNQVNPNKNMGEIIHKEYKDSTINKIGVDSIDSFGVQMVWNFERIRVKLHDHTMERLEKSAGERPDANVVRRIISQHWNTFEKAMEEKEGYRLSILDNLIKQEYTKWKHIIHAEEMEYARMIESRKKEPRINYDSLCRTTPEQEGIGDISALLDEIF